MANIAQHDIGITWPPKVCKIMAFWATFRGVGPLFYFSGSYTVQLSRDAEPDRSACAKLLQAPERHLRLDRVFVV